MTTIWSTADTGGFHAAARPGMGPRLHKTLAVWRQRARERAELAGLDDRTLADIGLTRSEAEFLGNKPFWRE